MRKLWLSLALLCLCFGGLVARAEVIELEGTVKAVDADKREITIGKKTLDVTKKCQITIDGAEAKLTDLQPNQKVVVEYDDELEVAKSIAVGSPGHDGDAVAKVLKELQGVWVAIEMETNEQPVARVDVRRQHRRVTIKGNSYEEDFARDGKVLKVVGKFDINPKTHTFDFIGKGPAGAVLEYVGLYEVQEGKLRLCLRANVDGNAERPKKMGSAAQGKNWTAINVFERDKDDESAKNTSR